MQLSVECCQRTLSNKTVAAYKTITVELRRNAEDELIKETIWKKKTNIQC